LRPVTVILLQGSFTEFLCHSVGSQSGLLQGFVMHVVSRASKLDMLQHTLMHLKCGVRAAVLIATKPEKLWHLDSSNGTISPEDLGHS
jgi:hypothetical protein